MTERHIPFTLLRTPSWDPFRDWHQGSRLFDQSFGMPSLAEEFHAGFPSGSTHWPGYMRPSSAMAAAADMGAFMPSYQQQAMMQQPHSPMMGPMMMPHHSPMMAPGGPMMAQPAMMTHQNPMMGRALSRQLSSGMSEIKQTQDSWKVCLDVNHFSPEELVIKTLDGVVEITGKHEERRDEHGFVSRCFTRKYTLPASASMEKVTSTLSPEGMLTVEAPLSRHTVKASEISIPITMGTKTRTGVVKEAEDEEE